ncbi:unnamed protein product [Fusarium graminearum]|nr:unnamed protein product [Fusarium graminearum]
MKLLNGCVKAAIVGHDIPQLDRSQSILNCGIRQSSSRVGVQPHATSINKECVLRHADKSGANLLARNRADVKAVYDYATTVEVYHAKEARNHRTLTAVGLSV